MHYRMGTFKTLLLKEFLFLCLIYVHNIGWLISSIKLHDCAFPFPAVDPALAPDACLFLYGS